MAVAGSDRGPLWINGRFAVRILARGFDSSRVIRPRRPFAMVGRLPEVEIRFNDPAVEDRHVFLLMDRHGVFGVDLRTRTGTRFAGEALSSSRLRLGDIVEVAGRGIELVEVRVNGSVVDPPRSSDDPLDEADASSLAALTLEPLGVARLPWMLGSALAFAGSGEACAIRVEGNFVSTTHCALFRGPSSAYVIDLLGRRTLVNDRPIDGASSLLEGDILTIGEARYLVHLEPGGVGVRTLSRMAGSFDEPSSLPDSLTGSPQAALLALALAGASRSAGDPQREVLEALRLFQSDTATLIEAQIARIETLGREIAVLRETIQGSQAPREIRLRPEPLQLDRIPPASSGSTENATWLLDRIHGLESESRSIWKDLISRVAATVRPRTIPDPLSGDRS